MEPMQSDALQTHVLMENKLQTLMRYTRGDKPSLT